MQSVNSRSLAIANPDLQAAFQAFAEDPEHFSPLLCFRGWINPFSEEDVHYVEEAPVEEALPDRKDETSL